MTALLTVEVDFGLAAFDNAEQWMEIDVDGQTLSPRQALTRTPYSMQMRGVTSDENLRVGIGVAPNDSARLRVWTDNPNLAMDVLSQGGDGINVLASPIDAFAVRGQAEGAIGLGVVGENTQSGSYGLARHPAQRRRGLFDTRHRRRHIRGDGRCSGIRGLLRWWEQWHGRLWRKR